jgi:hypothetical protein
MNTAITSKSMQPLEQAYRDMMRAQPTRDVFYLHNFMETLLRLDPESDGFAPRDVEAVEAAWGSYDVAILWHGGFVVRLRDGRRVYIESDAGGDWGHDAKVGVEMLTADRRYPNLPADHYQRLFGWDDAPIKELDEYLKRLAS